MFRRLPRFKLLIEGLCLTTRKVQAIVGPRKIKMPATFSVVTLLSFDINFENIS